MGIRQNNDGIICDIQESIDSIFMFHIPEQYSIRPSILYNKTDFPPPTTNARFQMGDIHLWSKSILTPSFCVLKNLIASSNEYFNFLGPMCAKF